MSENRHVCVEIRIYKRKIGLKLYIKDLHNENSKVNSYLTRKVYSCCHLTMNFPPFIMKTCLLRFFMFSVVAAAISNCTTGSVSSISVNGHVHLKVLMFHWCAPRSLKLSSSRHSVTTNPSKARSSVPLKWMLATPPEFHSVYHRLGACMVSILSFGVSWAIIEFGGLLRWLF